MRTVTIEQNIYTFDELSEAAKNKAINEMVMDIMQHDYSQIVLWWPSVAKAIDKAERLQTPWFAGEIIWRECGEEVVLPLLKNSEFLDNGEWWGNIESA